MSWMVLNCRRRSYWLTVLRANGFSIASPSRMVNSAPKNCSGVSCRTGARLKCQRSPPSPPRLLSCQVREFRMARYSFFTL